MARKAKPYLKDGWYCTSIGGVQHQKLCRAEEGLNQAELALARLMVQRADARDSGTIAPVPGPGVQLVIPPEKLGGPKSALTNDVLKDFLATAEVEVAPETFIGYKTALATFYERFAERPI